MIYKLKLILIAFCVLAIFNCSMPVFAAEISVSAKAAVVINADTKEEIVFTSGSTESLNMIVNGYFKYNLKENAKTKIVVIALK